MIEQTLIYRETGTNPYRNLATEQFLLENVGAGQCVLYLWQNARTVVIGRNQNAHAECRVERLAADGGFLARRLSGGGSVYHDLGNLNFTFLMNSHDYDLERQLAVIARACGHFGLAAEKSGRNDLCIGGRKFSGNAFYSHKWKSYHHGTILLDADTEMMSKYLIVDNAKLQSKGVKSVGSRVVNLRELCPSITVEDMASAVERAFGIVYKRALDVELSSQDEREIERLTSLYAGENWLFGRKIRADFAAERRFPWGAVTLNLQIEGGKTAAARVFSDSMDEGFSETLERALTGRDFSQSALTLAVNGATRRLGEQVAADVISLICEQDIW